MADRDDARPEFNPKHRIVGAIVLVTLAVVILPMILSEQSPPTDRKDPGESSARQAPTETKVIVTPVPAPEIKPTNITAAKSSEPQPSDASATVPEKQSTPVKTQASPVTPSKPAANKLESGWSVQVGTFSNTQNAIRLRDRLKKIGLQVHTESVTLSGKKAMRLRVGPYSDRTKAEKAQAQIRKETGVVGVVQAPS